MRIKMAEFFFAQLAQIFFNEQLYAIIVESVNSFGVDN